VRLQPLDALNIVSQGVLQGLGRQLQLAALNLVGYWGVGMSTAFIVAFRVGLGMKGIWIGLIVAVTFTGECAGVCCAC
jgi:multidrug resistance protein, MATE family